MCALVVGESAVSYEEMCASVGVEFSLNTSRFVGKWISLQFFGFFFSGQIWMPCLKKNIHVHFISFPFKFRCYEILCTRGKLIFTVYTEKMAISFVCHAQNILNPFLLMFGPQKKTLF